jgi:heterodisulfide reductase subunit A-like polyferredoxin
MYAIKDSMIAKEHSPGDLDCAVFNMDIRSFGKNYEEYYKRARDKQGVRFIKARIHSITEVPETGDLIVQYPDEAGDIKEETFNMIVLSVGFQIPDTSVELAQRLGVDLNKYNFMDTDSFTPVSTSRAGVYTCGIFQGPKDIPESVTQASAAASAAGVKLAEARGTLIKTVEIHVGQNLFTCSQDSQEQMKELIKEHNLNRIVVSACSPKTHEPIFMDTMEACGINKYLFEMANIRNQNSWVHSSTPEVATEKAKELVRMSVARAANLSPLKEKVIPVNKQALVIGGGVAGMTAALDLNGQGFEVFLVEKETELGGLARRLHHTIEGGDIQDYLKTLIGRVESAENINVLTDTSIVGFGGYKGNFTTDVEVGSERKKTAINHGVIIVATGAKEYTPKEYLYGEDDRIVTQLELGDILEKKGASDLSSVVMIQCVGSRNEEHPNCSRICCQNAVKNAISIKKLNPDALIYILYRDIRTYGLMEDYYTEAREKGVIFIRFDEDAPPDVKISPEGLLVTVKDHVLQRDIEVSTDLLTLSAGVVAADTDEVSGIMKLNRNPEGFFIEAHVKLRPVDMPSEGIFLCGTAHGPKLIAETISQAHAAASRATTFLSKSEIKLSAITAKVDTDYCVKCLTCVRCCPFDVPIFNEDDKVIEIDEAICHGCGVCACVCPRQTIQLSYYEDDQIMSKIDALLAGGM